ncbi:unnamed protein product [Notodromas monacha]|uniref:Cuticle protein n=1 Tax=Notodromas monacha TaxID=399045 RepID=A0A7R9C181_9CRUS|nr:unnamed protein product [Notodromas monacha]CAD7284449.1 unnamed protein product [Notodromas monacha]CAG0917894.1 unnamed protein product [Notodromas monacha]CAG0924601.1 unnamed protein product [Notodromas monacha]
MHSCPWGRARWVPRVSFILAAVIVGVCVADSQPAYRPAQPYRPAAYQSYDAPPKYSFDWSVRDDYTYNNYNHQESRDGDNTQGSYSVLLPDGRVQTVKYYVNGDSGFVAEVTYSGEPKYEASYQKPAYKPAPAAYQPAQKPAYRPRPAYQPTPYPA